MSTPCDGSQARLLEHLRDRVPPSVLAAVAAVDRRRFVPAALHDQAWEDRALPIDAGQSISQPSLVAQMAALVDPRPGDRVLDVGTGSGYHAAVLAQLGRTVVSIERHAELSRAAAASLATAGVGNVQLVIGDGGGGHPAGAPYDVISVAATVTGEVPPALIDQLADGGRLLLPIRDGEERLLLIRRDGDRLTRTPHGRVRFVPFLTTP